ncbi:MAG: DUF4190 domain-containing protein [Crocinitomicaceae bacterium]|nr:DUF4190 domain-containing protein [Crocinitomicaceae bacterium]
MTDGTTKKNGMATAAMVLGIISLALFWTGWIGLLVGIVAIILAVVAKNQIKADPSMAGSEGQAKGGLIMGIIGVVLALVMIIIAVLFVNAVANEFEDAAMDYQEQLDALDDM